MQSEFLTLRSSGLKARAALDAMFDWRVQAARSLIAVEGVWPRVIVDEVVRLQVEMAKIAVIRRQVFA